MNLTEKEIEALHLTSQVLITIRALARSENPDLPMICELADSVHNIPGVIAGKKDIQKNSFEITRARHLLGADEA